MTQDREEEDIGHMDDVNSLDAANRAVDAGMALRVQPPAPGYTRYYFVDEDGWKLQKAGEGYATSPAVEHVRQTVDRMIPKNDRAGGGGVKAVDKTEKIRACTTTAPGVECE